MRKRQNSKVFEEPTINLTPLIDVVFVILIMFIMIAPLVEIDQVELAPGPQGVKETSSMKASSPIAIHVQKNNQIFLNQQLVALVELPELLRKQKMQHPTAMPQLFHDKAAHFGIYQSVKNAAEEAGFIQMDIVLNPS